MAPVEGLVCPRAGIARPADTATIVKSNLQVAFRRFVFMDVFLPSHSSGSFAPPFAFAASSYASKAGTVTIFPKEEVHRERPLPRVGRWHAKTCAILAASSLTVQ